MKKTLQRTLHQETDLLKENQTWFWSNLYIQLTNIVQKIQKTEEYVKLLHRVAIIKIQRVRNSLAKRDAFFYIYLLHGG